MVALVALLALPGAHAQTLRTFIADLYGGNGIQTFNNLNVPFSFDQTAIDQLNALSDGISQSIGQTGLNSSVSAFVFDVSQGIPVAVEDSMGPVLAERATTIGAGKANVGLAYSRVKFKKFEGEDLDRITRILNHVDCCSAGPGGSIVTTPDGVLGPNNSPTDFETNQIQLDLAIKLEQRVLAFFGTYGITENWDVGAIIPVVETRARANARATVIRNAIQRSRNFTELDRPPGDNSVDSTGGTETGIGDIVLRTKYNFWRNEESKPDAAVVGQVSLPTGDEDDLLGSGETSFLGMLVASKKFDRVTPHLNLGYEASTDSDRNNLRYIVGADVEIIPRQMNAAVEILGRYLHEQPSTRNHLVDIAFTTKFDPFQIAPISAAVIIPLNSAEGLRSDVIWSIGLEHTF